MSKMRNTLPFTFLALTLFTSCDREKTVADHIVAVKENDKQIEEAVKAALAELPEFWIRFDNPRPGDEHFAVKVHIADSNGSEYFWMNEIRRAGDKVSGVIDQQPQIVKSIKVDQRISVPQSEVIDWLIMANGKMKGNFTLRALKGSMSKADLDQLIPLLDENPSIRTTPPNHSMHSDGAAARPRR